MFAISTTQESLGLTALLILWAALLLGSVVADWRLPSERSATTITWLRLASSATLVVAAVTWYLVARATPTTAGFALLVAGGMLFGFLGDLLLADELSLKNGFLAGIAIFAVGHVAYIAAILTFSPHILWPVEGGALSVGLAGWYLVVFRATDAGTAGALRWAALPYALLLATTAGLAIGLALQAPIFLPLAIGATLFLLSDLLVAGERFGRLCFPHLGDAIWLTYGPAQMLIVYAINSALVVAAAR